MCLRRFSIIAVSRSTGIDHQTDRQTDKTITANKPDVVVKDRSMRLALIINNAVPHDGNLVKAEIDKQSKYLD